jgi:Plant transposon protein
MNSTVQEVAAEFLFEEDDLLLNESEDKIDDDQVKVDHRQFPRNSQRKYNREHVIVAINCDYLGPNPLFNGREFNSMFRFSRTHFEAIRSDIGKEDIHFFTHITDIFGCVGPCMEARMMLALKTMAYGIPPHMLRDQFQMSVMMARECCIEFDNAFHELYDSEYLRLPTNQDIVAINKLHKVVHGLDGMFGSLDCMHTYSKNCPMAWQGSYNGKEKKPTWTQSTSSPSSWVSCSCCQVVCRLCLVIITMKLLVPFFIIIFFRHGLLSRATTWTIIIIIIITGISTTSSSSCSSKRRGHNISNKSNSNNTNNNNNSINQLNALFMTTLPRACRKACSDSVSTI